MIKTLRKKISIIFASLLGAIWVLIIVLFNWSNYKGQLRELRSSVRLEIKESGWNKFLKTGGEDEAFDLKDLEYCVVQLKEDGTVSVLANHFPSIPEESLTGYIVEQRKNNWTLDDGFSKITYISKFKKKYGKCLVLISTKPALRAEMKLAAVSLVIAVAGIFVLIAAVKYLSGWLVRPVEESIQSEKKFMSNASHELKTPLTVIRTNIELLSDEIGGNKHLQYIGMETERMVSLVNKMLTLVRLDAHYTEQKFQKFRLDEALLNVIYPMESVAYEKNIRMDIQVEEGMGFTGNEEQIQSVMSILLDNAISYTSEGGSIEISAKIHSRKFYLIVANTGDPIPAELKDKMFERFYRQDEARESTSEHLGLGLSIAKSIVEKHHGKIRVESAGGMNIFHVVLPVVKKG